MARSRSKHKIVTDVPRLSPRPPEMHKGDAGRVALIAGSRGMSGAACLAGLAALRGGAGLVRVYSPAGIQPLVAASEPCLMTVPLPEDDAGCLVAEPALARLREDLAWPTVIAIGPGLGQSAQLENLVLAILHTFPGPLVLDADGLNNLAHSDPLKPWWPQRGHRPTVVTPHPGEMARLRTHAGLKACDEQDAETRLAVAFEYAALTGAVTVLKGHGTVVACPDAAYVNTTGNPGMATAGMGDVLTGLIAALLGQGLPTFDAACLAVHCHGTAADALAKHIAPVGYLAREVADALPGALAAASRASMGFKSTRRRGT